MVVRVSSKGQIVLPASIRKSLDIKPGDELIVVEWGGALYLVPKMKNPIREGKGLLKRLGSTLTVDQFLAERKAEEERRERHLMGIPDE